jgi:hypothetical protein
MALYSLLGEFKIFEACAYVSHDLAIDRSSRYSIKFLEMNEIAKLIVTLVTVFSLVGSIGFYLTMISGSIRIYQGDYNATQDMAQAASDEIVGALTWSVVIGVAIAICSALGLGFIVAILKKL